MRLDVVFCVFFSVLTAQLLVECSADILDSCNHIIEDPDLLERIDFAEAHFKWGVREFHQPSFQKVKEVLRDIENNYAKSEVLSAWGVAESKYFFFDADDVLIATCELPRDATLKENRQLFDKIGFKRIQKTEL